MADSKTSEHEARKYAESIINTVREPLIVLNHDLKVVTASRSFYAVFKISPEEAEGQLIYDLGHKQWDIPELRELLETILPQKTTLDDYEIEHKFTDIGSRTMLVNAREIQRKSGKERLILLAIEDITERKRQENLLLESEERYRRLFETANDAMVLLEKAEGKITHANPAIARMFGYSHDEFIGKRVKDIGFPGNIGTIQDILQTLEKDGILHYKDAPVQTKTGQLIDTDIYMVDKAMLVQCNIRDITERKQMKEDLRESLERYRLLVEASNDLAWIFDLSNMSFTYCSKSVETILGYSQAEVNGAKLDDIFMPETKKKVVGAFNKVFKGETNSDRVFIEAEHRHKDGSLVWMEISAVMNRDNMRQTVSFTGVSRNITERKHAEEALRQSENYYRAIFETSGTAMFITEEDTTIPLVNSNFEKLSGYLKQEVEGKKSWTEFIHPDDVGWMKENHYLRRQNPDAAPRQYEFRFITRHEEERNVLLAVDIIPGTNRSIASCIDITERKKAEQEKEKLQSQLRQSQKMEAIGTLAGGVAHDFNNILSSVLGYTELSLEEVEKDSLVHQNLSQVLTAGNRARDLVKQILRLSRREEQEFVPTPVVPLVKEALKMLRSTFPATIDIQENIRTEQAIVHADPTQLHQAIINLATNARDAMSDGSGVLEVYLEPVTFDQSIRKKSPDIMPGDYICIAISDTGCGISDQYLNKIFEPYFTTKEKGTGTGLGLSMVHGIVKSHKGHISAHSEPGKGTAFYIYLPLAEQSRPVPLARKAEPLPTGTEKILLVDDEQPIVEIQQRILERLGYEVTPRTSSIEALEAFRANPDKFDVLITDMAMPNMTGDRLAREVKQIRPGLPVILSTGFSEKMNKHNKEDLGVDGFLMKPVTKSSIAEMVRQVLDEPKV